MIKAFELVRLGEDDVKAKFPAMYNAFCYGAPPHAGIAPGVDRMVMLLAGEDSIREIIPFPMNKNAQDIMMGAPDRGHAEAARRAAHRRDSARGRVIRAHRRAQASRREAAYISKGPFSTVENGPFGTPRERKGCALDLPLEVFL